LAIIGAPKWSTYNIRIMKIRLYTIPLVIASISLIIIFMALQFELSPPMIVGESMQARSFPIFLMIINLVLVTFLAVQFFNSNPEPVPLEGPPTWGTMLLLIIFYLLTISTDMFIGIAVVMFFMSYLWGERRIYLAALTAIITPISIFFLFDLVLRVRFPRGVLIDWYYG